MKRLQVLFSDEAWEAIESATNSANENFEMGSISYSDVVNEMALHSKIDIKALQYKHTDIRRSLRVMASKSDIDLESVIKTLMELKSKSAKRKNNAQDEVNHERN